jgi:hypothetical protein
VAGKKLQWTSLLEVLQVPLKAGRMANAGSHTHLGMLEQLSSACLASR